MATPMPHAGVLCRSCFNHFSWFMFKRYTHYMPCGIHKLFYKDPKQPKTLLRPIYPIRLDIARCCCSLSPATGRIKILKESSYCSSSWPRRCENTDTSLHNTIHILKCRFSQSSTLNAQYERKRNLHESSYNRCSEKEVHRKEERTHRSKEFIAKQKKIKAALKFKVADISEDIKTIPNLLTLLRMLSAPVLGSLIVYEQFTWAAGLFLMAGITDVMDGYIARNFKNQKSMLGSFIDPLADKMLVTVLAVTLTMVDLIPVPLVVLIIGRDVGLIAAAFYIRYLSLPSPKTVSRYFDLTLPTAKLYPSTLSKFNTALQLSLVALTLAAPVFDYVNHPYLQALWYITAITTFSSGLQYVLSAKSFFKVLQKKSSEEKLSHQKR